MGNRLDDLFLSFQTKGFMPIEIPGLIQESVRQPLPPGL